MLFPFDTSCTDASKAAIPEKIAKTGRDKDILETACSANSICEKVNLKDPGCSTQAEEYVMLWSVMRLPASDAGSSLPGTPDTCMFWMEM